MTGARNTWEDPAIVSHVWVDHDDPDVRAAAELIHANESLHRHAPAGPTCIYCAIVATRAVRVARRRIRARLNDARVAAANELNRVNNRGDDDSEGIAYLGYAEGHLDGITDALGCLRDVDVRTEVPA